MLTAMSSVLVIGGTRFFGLDAVRQLEERGHRVVVLSRRALDPRLARGVESIAGLRDDPAALAAAFERGPYDVVLDNIAMTPGEVDAVVAAGRGRIGHYLLVSTGSVYLERTARPLGEDDAKLAEPDPAGDDFGPKYARGKRASERAVAASGVPWSVVRPTIVCGPRDPTNRLTWYADRVAADAPIDPSQFTYNPVFSQDLANLLVELTENPRPGRAYNAAGADVVTVDQLVEAIRRVTRALRLPPPAEMSIEPPPLPSEGALVMKIDRAASELGWRPSALDDWLAHTLPRRS